MELRIEEVSPVEKKLIVEVPWDAVSNKLGESYRQLGRSVQIKGFRKGKVPRSVLERLYGERVKAEVAEDFVRESFRRAVSEHKLAAVSEPQVEGDMAITKGQPLCFAAIVEVTGDFEISDYRGLQLTRDAVIVSDDEVADALQHLQRSHTELRPIEGRDTLTSNDFVALAIKGTLGEHEIDRPQITMDLGFSEQEPLPGLAAALIDLPVATSDHVIELNMPDDYKDETVRGQVAKLTISVLDARQKDTPEIDDAFAVDTGKAETLEQLRGVLRGEIEEAKNLKADEKLRELALEKLVELNPIPVASSLIDRTVHDKYHRLQRMIGLEDHNHDHHIEPELREKLVESARNEIRGQLILEALCDKESIEVSEEEIDSRLAEIASATGKQLGQLKSEMMRSGRLEGIRFQVRQNKALDLVIAQASVKTISPGEEPEAP